MPNYPTIFLPSLTNYPTISPSLLDLPATFSSTANLSHHFPSLTDDPINFPYIAKLPIYLFPVWPNDLAQSPVPPSLPDDPINFPSFTGRLPYPSLPPSRLLIPNPLWDRRSSKDLKASPESYSGGRLGFPLIRSWRLLAIGSAGGFIYLVTNKVIIDSKAASFSDKLDPTFDFDLQLYD